MKRLLLLGVGSALVFTMGGVGPAQADNGPHMSGAQGPNSTTSVKIANVGAERCATCHRAHTAVAENLLVQAQPALCYSCHNGMKASTSPADGIQYSADGKVVGALRGGGFNNARIGSGAATKDMGAQDAITGRIATLNQTIPVGASQGVTSTHAIDGNTSGTAWGNGPINGNTVNGDTPTGKTMKLECGSCHDPHGNGNYRILRPVPVESQWSTGVADVSTTAVDESKSPVISVKIPDANAKVYVTDNYWLAGDGNVPTGGTPFTSTTVNMPQVPTVPGQTDGYIQNVAAWCTTCHTRYLAGSKSYQTENKGYDRTTGKNILTVTAPTDTTFMYRHRSDANYKAGAANCITCHVSHGSNAQMAQASAVTDPGASVNASPTMGSRLLRVDNRGTCLMCHNV